MTKILLFLSSILDSSRLIALCLSKKGIFFSSITLGLIATLGYAPFNLWPITLGALVLLFILISSLKSLKAVFFATILFFTSLNLITLSWLSFVMEGFGEMPALAVWPIITVFSILICIPYGIATTLSAKLCKNRRSIMLCAYIPAFFILADLTVGYVAGGFPWMYLGNTCVSGPFSGFASLIGVRGIDALFVLTAGALAMAALRHFLYLPLAALILALGSFSSSLTFTTPNEGTLKVALVQGNIEQNLHIDNDKLNEIIATYWGLSRDLFGKYDLIIWPESALPLTIEKGLGLLTDLNAVSYDNHTNLVTGILSTDANGKIFNSILTLGKDQKLKDFSTYNKRKLVPFGEFVPLASLLRPLGKIFNIPMSSFSQGAYVQEPLEVANKKFSPAICYEAIYPEIISSVNSSDSGAILMVSNDSWFGPTRAPLQHLDMAKMRSLELQKPMLRCTNSGITTVINSKGQLEESIPSNKPYVLSANFKTYKGLTPYAKYGDLGVVILMIVFGITGFALSRKKVNKINEDLQHLVRP